MGPEQLKKVAAAKEKYALIDVREDNEWAAGHAAGAMHISRGVLEKGIETSVPQRNAKIILYCHSGARSALAADTLQKMGYSDVYSLAGGFVAYEKSGLPLEKSSGGTDEIGTKSGTDGIVPQAGLDERGHFRLSPNSHEFLSA
jgi:rhodanese-related sulfurtransferase